MSKLKETQALAAKLINRNLNIPNRQRDIDSCDENRSEAARNLVESLGSDITSEMVGGIVNNMLSTNTPGYDFDEKYSWRNLKEGIRNARNAGKLRETNVATTLGSLTTLGVETLLLTRYQVPTTSYQAISTVYASTADTQIYADTFRPGLPQLTNPGQQAPQVNLQPVLGSTVKNYKWMSKLVFTSEIAQDDQTGKIAMASSEAADGMKYIFESWMAAVLLDSPGTAFGGYTIPSIAFQTYKDEDGTSGVYQATGLRQNRPASFSVVSTESLRILENLAYTIKQPDGQIIGVLPDSLWHHPIDRIIVDTLLTSPVWPGSVNTADTGSLGITGATTGQINSNNPFKGRYTPVENVLLPYNTSTNSGAWGLVCKQRQPIIMQEREELQLLMEAPNAGYSFEGDVIQWRVRKRATLFTFPGCARFLFLGNSGI